MNDCKMILIILFVCTILYACYYQVREDFVSHDPKLLELTERLRKIFPSEMKDVKFVCGKKSYTINKNKVHICMQNGQKEYYDDQILLNVIIHELAHVCNKDVGHTPSFYKTFDELLKKATDEGVYDTKTVVPSDYCIY